MDVTRRRKMKMAVYMAMDGEGKRVNLVEIEEGQVVGWERATGMKLVKVEEADGDEIGEGGRSGRGRVTEMKLVEAEGEEGEEEAE